MSNLLLCPEGLTNNVQFNCTVQPFVGIEENLDEKFNVLFPVASNNYQLSVSGAYTSLFITDVTGKMLFQSEKSESAQFGMTHLPAGLYNLVIVDGDRQYARKFTKQ
jgi:hypothetical protein